MVLDGSFYIFVRFRDGHWRIDDPVRVDAHSTETFLRYLLSLSTELALTPENLVRDFGENSNAARAIVPVLYRALRATDDPKTGILFEQWRRQFSEITGYEKGSAQLDVVKLARSYAVADREPDAESLFFALHTYYATFIKLLAVQIATYYLMPKVGAGLAQEANRDSAGLREAAQIFGGLLDDEKAPTGINSKARLALVALWLNGKLDARPPCRPLERPGKPVGVMIPHSVEARGRAREHLACVRQRGTDVDEVTRLQARLDELLLHDKTACQALGRTAFGALGETGVLSVLATSPSHESGPCRKPGPWGRDALLSELGVGGSDGPFGGSLGSDLGSSGLGQLGTVGKPTPKNRAAK